MSKCKHCGLPIKAMAKGWVHDVALRDLKVSFAEYAHVMGDAAGDPEKRRFNALHKAAPRA